MGFRLVPKWVTLNGVLLVILRYFNEFGRFGGQLRKSGEERPILSATKMQFKESRFQQYMTYGVILRVF